MQPSKRNVQSSGFTLIELMVSVAIVSLLSSLIVANHSRFNNSLLLGNLAYDIALSVRQAQVYGLSVKGSGSGFQVGYGVHFSSPTSFIFFADANTNRVYDAETDSIVETYAIGQGNFISKFCGVLSTGSETCSDGSPAITYLDVVFLRPDPDAIIIGSISGTPYSSGKIYVQSPAGDTREVDIAATGQISVKTPTP